MFLNIKYTNYDRGLKIIKLKRMYQGNSKQTQSSTGAKFKKGGHSEKGLNVLKFRYDLKVGMAH